MDAGYYVAVFLFLLLLSLLFAIPYARSKAKVISIKPFNAVRLDHRGEVDDVAIECTLFRMERMDEDSWWIAAYRGEKRVTFALELSADGMAINAVKIEDDLGTEDDSQLPPRLCLDTPPVVYKYPVGTVDNPWKVE